MEPVTLIALALITYVVAQRNETSIDAETGSGVKPISPVYPIGQGVIDFAHAIRAAENSPADWNNPGDLALGDQGFGVGNSANVTKFGTPDAGWSALYGQLQAIISLSGHSHWTDDISIATFADGFTGGDNAAAWAATVVQRLNAAGYSVDESTPIGDVLRS